MTILTSVRIADSVYIVVGGAFPRCNTMVVVDDEVVVIDPGCGIEDLRRFLLQSNLSLKDVDTVILSHIHPDHIVHATRINRLSRCRIAANEITAPLFNEKEKMKEFLGFVKTHPVRPLWEKLVNEKMYGALDDGRVDEVLGDGDKFALGDVTLRTLYTPGHTPDHMCVELLEENLVFGADIDLTEFGPYYGHPNSSIPEFRESIRLLQHRNYRGLISGHLKDPLVEDYKTGLAAYSRQFSIREDLVLSAIMDGANSVEEITLNPIIYPSLTNPVYLQFERWMIEHHVSDLVRKNLVQMEDNRLRAA
jgi:glyoxylase-like metal-dependent hydrolase (beta-lactamase superfamily II)